MCLGHRGLAHLATLLDLYLRGGIGWMMDTRLTEDLTLS